MDTLSEEKYTRVIYSSEVNRVKCKTNRESIFEVCDNFSNLVSVPGRPINFLTNGFLGYSANTQLRSTGLKLGSKTCFSPSSMGSHYALHKIGGPSITNKSKYRYIAPYSSGGYKAIGKKRKWGLLSSQNDTLIDFIQDSISDVSTQKSLGHRFGQKKNRLSIINDVGMQVYTNDSLVDAQFLTQRYSRIKLGNFWHLFDSKTLQLHRVYGTKIKHLENGYFAFRKSMRWGIVDSIGNVIVKAKYVQIKGLKHDQFIAKTFKWGIVSLDGDTLLPFSFNDINIYDSYYIARNSKRNFTVYDLELIPLLRRNMSYYKVIDGHLVINTLYKKRIYDLNKLAYMKNRFRQVYDIKDQLVDGQRSFKRAVYNISNGKAIVVSPKGTAQASLLDSGYYVVLSLRNKSVEVYNVRSKNVIQKIPSQSLRVFDGRYVMEQY